MQIRRVISGLIACLALAQLSLSSVIARCVSPQMAAHETMTMAHMGAPNLRAAAAASDSDRPMDHDGSSCHHLAQSDCAGMVSCTSAMCAHETVAFALVQRGALIVPQGSTLLLALARAPEPPPPRA